jgi:xanthine dehydrogenase YagR molybdenum-binding subunit
MCGARAKAYSLRGDPAAALAAADIVVRERYGTAVNNHHAMEPHAVVCEWEGDRVVVHTCTQAVFGTRAIIAGAFGLPPENVRVVARFLGGGFGSKGQLWWPYMMLALLAARRVGRPVRLELTRAQMFSLVGRRQETVQDLALGATRDGRLTAIDHQVLSQTSTHAEYADPVAYASRLLYACPNVVTRHRLVRTNEPHPIPMRGPGEAPGSFALESALDELAHALNLDPVELRLRNHADHDQDNSRPWSSNGSRECWRQGAERFGWVRRPQEGWSEGRIRIGWGMATSCYPARRQPSRSRVRIEPDGSLLVQCGTQDMGSGTYTLLAQAAAHVLGVTLDRVRVELGDTWLPEGPFSGGSQVTQSVWPAVDQAARAVREQIASFAAADRDSPLFGSDPGSLAFSDDAVRDPAGNASESLAGLLGRCAPQGVEAEGDVPLSADQSVTGMGFGAVFAEVAVDPDLGEVRVRRICAAYAAGHIVNPLLARSQYVGGLIGGIGMALHEQTLTDRASGRILGDTLADYLIPVHADIPDIDIVMVEEDDPYLPGGIKGVGMLGAVGTSAAIQPNPTQNRRGGRLLHHQPGHDPRDLRQAPQVASPSRASAASIWRSKASRPGDAVPRTSSW